VVVYVDYADYDDVTADCVISELSVTGTVSPVYVTAFYSRDARDAVACSNGSASSTAVHVVSLTNVERRSDDVRRRLPRIRVNIMWSSVPASSSSEGELHHLITYTIT